MQENTECGLPYNPDRQRPDRLAASMAAIAATATPNTLRGAGQPPNTIRVEVLISGRHSFEVALRAIKDGERVTRTGWNGKGMFLYLQNCPEGSGHLQHIMMHTAQGHRVPWVASHTDMLSHDWAILPANQA